VGVLAYLAVWQGDLYSASAYAWALAVVPLEVYAAVWVGLFLLGAVIVWDARLDGRAGLCALLVWSAVYAIVQVMFALSIFMLSFDGYPGAAAGSLQWGGLAVVAWLWLRHKEG
tara:strand:- start:883 stop:1224 length:342 start_codon:yes stop_codon:yes gene_type:complete